MVICLQRDADLHMAQLMPVPLTVSCFSKIQIGFTFWYRLTRAVLDKGPLNGCVCSGSSSWYLVLQRLREWYLADSLVASSILGRVAVSQLGKPQQTRLGPVAAAAPGQIPLTLVTTGWQRGAAVSGVRRTNEVNERRARLAHGWVNASSGGYTISVCNKPTRSTQPCIPPGSLNGVPVRLG